MTVQRARDELSSLISAGIEARDPEDPDQLADRILAAGYRKHAGPELTDALQQSTEVDAGWIEYRSAVVYEGGSIRETGPTRRSMDGAMGDVDDEEPPLDSDDDEDPVRRAIVCRQRYEPGPWSVVKEIR